MQKQTIKDIDCKEKRILVRVDFNVPLQDGKVVDDMRIRAALPTIQYLLERKARVILCSHLGRPKGKVVEALRLTPAAVRLSELLGQKIYKVDACTGSQVAEAAAALQPGEVLMLENTRFYPGETTNDPFFSAELAKPAELYVNDAFGAAHRAHASTEGVGHYLFGVAGMLMKQELKALDRVSDHPEKPFAAIFGGAKISDKIGVIERFLDHLDYLLVGGGMANTFLMAKGVNVGKSLVEEKSIDTAKQIMETAGDKLILPVDVVATDKIAPDADYKTVDIQSVPSDRLIVDVGGETISLFEEKLATARTIIWNGPLGVTEIEPFAKATRETARILSQSKAVTIVGGGDSAAAVIQSGFADKMTHVSTGGGAFLEYLAGNELPGVAVLKNKD